MTSTDVESLEPSPRSRSRCLDTCLLGSVITLFVMVLGGAVAALVILQHSDVTAFQPSGLQGLSYHRTGNPELINYKGQNFAFLRAISEEVKDGVMSWESVPYGQGQTVGARYSYDPTHSALTMTHEGSYFLYTQLQIRCLHLCNNTTLTVTFEDQGGRQHLSCSVELSDSVKTVARKCWTVIPHLDKGSRLLAKAIGMSNWRLDMNESGFGMFLVDGL